MNENFQNDDVVEEPVVGSLERGQWWTAPTAILALIMPGSGLWMFLRTSGALGDLA